MEFDDYDFVFGIEQSIPAGHIEVEVYGDGKVEYKGVKNDERIPVGPDGHTTFFLAEGEVDELYEALETSVEGNEDFVSMPDLSLKISHGDHAREYSWIWEDVPEEVVDIKEDLYDEAERHLDGNTFEDFR